LIWPKDKFTKFEVARLLGARTLQIALWAPVLVKTDFAEPVLITKQEFKEKMIPITIKRKLPSEEEIMVEAKKAIANWLDQHKGEI
jgi:DNA-directed RNA polymerase subunit K